MRPARTILRRLFPSAALILVLPLVVSLLAAEPKPSSKDKGGAKAQPAAGHDHADHQHAAKDGKVTIGGRTFVPVDFSIRSVRDGRWSEAKTWEPARVPAKGDRVLISRGTDVQYDAASDDVIRLVQVVGALRFARDRDTLLNVGVLKAQNSDHCSETGFACDLHDVSDVGEPYAAPPGPMPMLEIGTPENPIPAQYTARIRLHYLDGMNKDDAPALACCAARMDLHGAPMSRTWVKLGADVAKGEKTVTLAEPVTGWKVGDEVIVTASKHQYSGGRFRDDPSLLGTETRKIVKLEGTKLTLDAPLEYPHEGAERQASEVANLSRNVIVESADPKGVRGHTIYHQFSAGGISYARLAHLGKENTLGRYAIHFHLVGDTMRGGGVIGAAIVDSHNRWVTVHGTNYMLVRDCVGYQSIGHGFFLEDGTEVYTMFDRNLGVQAFRGKRLPKQVMPFDPNDGACFWWANGRNTFVRNVAVEGEEYGYRYDSQKRSNFDSVLPVRSTDGKIEKTDIRTLPVYRFTDNEVHTTGLYGAALDGTDLVGPDTRHPHRLSNFNIWEVHYGLRSQLPTMLIENVLIDRAAYGIYRPQFINHVYRNLTISHTETEPFNRGLDDESLQYGSIAVDGLTFVVDRYGSMPLIQMSDNNPSGKAESHFRNVKVVETHQRSGRNVQPLASRGGGSQVSPKTPTSVPVFLHDYFGPGRTAKIVLTSAQDYREDDSLRSEPPLTGRESRVQEVTGVEFPKLLDPVDDQPPATIITWPRDGQTVKLEGDTLVVRGATTDDYATKRVDVNGVAASDVDYNFHQWEARITGLAPGKLTLTAGATDTSGNRERTPHVVQIEVR